MSRWLMRHALLSQYPAPKGSVLNNSELVKLPAIGKEGKSLKDCPEGVKELASLGALRMADATTLVETTQMG